jgi:hypothetical protein
MGKEQLTARELKTIAAYRKMWTLNVVVLSIGVVCSALILVSHKGQKPFFGVGFLSGASLVGLYFWFTIKKWLQIVEKLML